MLTGGPLSSGCTLPCHPVFQTHCKRRCRIRGWSVCTCESLLLHCPRHRQRTVCRKKVAEEAEFLSWRGAWERMNGIHKALQRPIHGGVLSRAPGLLRLAGGKCTGSWWMTISKRLEPCWGLFITMETTSTLPHRFQVLHVAWEPLVQLRGGGELEPLPCDLCLFALALVITDLLRLSNLLSLEVLLWTAIKTILPRSLFCCWG